MTTHYPRIRLRGIPVGYWRRYDGPPPRPPRELLAREVVRFAFYLPHDHADIAQGVSEAIRSYMRAVGEGPRSIQYVHVSHDEGSRLTEESWGHVHRLLQSTRKWSFPEDYEPAKRREVQKQGFERGLLFTGGLDSRNGYELEYRARIPWRAPPAHSVSLLTATLPTEYLEAHGPSRVRELAMEMASQLPFASGHAGLALRLYRSQRRADAAIRAEVFRHPGIDLRPAWLHTERMGTRIDGIHWLNFLAQPVLGQLGGVEALRARLRAAETEVQARDGARVLVALGEGPDAGDLVSGRTLPAYRELARVLESRLEPPPMAPTEGMDEPPSYTPIGFTEKEERRWWWRFLERDCR
jgi:hypothetical protein